MYLVLFTWSKHRDFFLTEDLALAFANKFIIESSKNPPKKTP